MKGGELNIPVIVLSVIGVSTLVLAISFVYMSLNGPNYTKTYTEKIQKGEIQNPISRFGLMFSDSQEIPEGAKVIKIQTEQGEKHIIIQADLGDFDISEVEKELVNYGAIILKLYNLHEVPFTGITPKVQIYIDENAYYIEITKGNIIIKDGETQKPDIIIRTTHEEIFKMIEDNKYAKESISSGKTSIEQVANKVVLFSKGYLDLYQEFSKISGFFAKKPL